MQLTVDQATEVYRLLRFIAGAPAEQESDFLHYVTSPSQADFAEWRFQGLLGFGGKFKNINDEWYVTCYSEDETPARRRIIQTLNPLLSLIKEKEE